MCHLADAPSSDSEAILELKAEAFAVQHRLALAKLERKRKRPEQETDANPGPSSEKLKASSKPMSIPTGIDLDTNMTVAASSNLSRPSKDHKVGKHRKNSKKAPESSEEEDETPVDPYWRKEYKKRPKGMHMTYPKNSNFFSASPWGLTNDNHGWNEFLGYIRKAVKKHFDVSKLWSEQPDKHQSFYKQVVRDYPILTLQKGYFTVTQTAAANLRYQVSLTDPSTSKRSRNSAPSTSVTPSVSRSSATPSGTSSLASIAAPDSTTIVTPYQQEPEGITDDLIDPALFPSAQGLAPILSMGGKDYGLPEMPIRDIPSQQLPAPSAPAGVNPATHFDGSLPSQDPVPTPSTQSRRTMVYQVSRDRAPSGTSQASHDAPGVATSSSRASLIQVSRDATAESQVSSANNPHLPTPSASISSSDAASILLDISQQAPAAHPFGTDTTPHTTPLIVPPPAKPKPQKAKAKGPSPKATASEAKGALRKASATPAKQAIRRSARGQK